ncbi:hypothetical protein PILCRDRAFT_823405 [Piloderma croceum F 1598]|uniref:Uncharacterized protein n=1 Tax=Piloderma croceum (strain F 1598) TaxID=765440 RepID=A0A0C3BQ92_PILCF|nr:hypothetical protein PILCRDRAFT_823405 [Piloderma croceum F 1598]
MISSTETFYARSSCIANPAQVPGSRFMVPLMQTLLQVCQEIVNKQVGVASGNAGNVQSPDVY